MTEEYIISALITIDGTRKDQIRIMKQIEELGNDECVVGVSVDDI